MVQYKVGLPLSPYSQKFGYEIPERLSTEQWRSIDITLAQANLQEQASKYNSFNLKSPTLLNYRDYFVYKAYEHFIRNTQYSDTQETSLTNKAVQTWQTLSFDDIWPYTGPSIAELKDPPTYGGELGSLAYYSQYVDSELPFPLVIEETLKFIWSICGSNYDKLPNQRLLDIINDCGFTPEIVNLIETYSKDLFDLQPTSKEYFLLVYARTRAVIPSSFSNLLLRVLFHEYQPEIFSSVLPLVPVIQQDKTQNALYNVSRLLPPSGFILLFQSLICESYIRCALFITYLDPSFYSLSLAQIESSKEFNFITLQISRLLCLAFDSLSALSAFSTFTQTDSELSSIQKDITAWLALSKSTISDKDDYRLYSFV
jgi:hypothetical protein